MSILTRLTSQHLDDAALAEIWTNAAADGSRPTHPHLDACAECRIRFASFTAWLDDIRTDALAEADDAFPPERLAAQQAAVLRRLEAADRPSRVIAFPRAAVAATPPSAMRRWIAAAAAAGLITGLGLGQLMQFGPRPGGPSVFPADRTTADAARAGTPGIVPAGLTDDMFDLEEASTPHYEALRAYDTFTPRAADFLQTSR